MKPVPQGAGRRPTSAPGIIRRTGADWIDPRPRLTAWERERRDGPIHPMRKPGDWWSTVLVTVLFAIAAALLVLA